MSKGKKVKATQPPSFKEPISLENIGKFIKARRTQQGLNTLDCAMLCNISAYTLNKIENGFEGVRLISRYHEFKIQFKVVLINYI